MSSKISSLLSNVQKTLTRYPLILLMSLIMTIAVILMIETPYESHKEPYYFLIIKIIITSSLGISLFFALKMLSQRIGKAFLWNILGILFLTGFFFILPKNENDFTVVYPYLIVPAFILSHLLVAFIPFLKKENNALRFWQYNKNLFVNFILTIIFTGVLITGVLLAILAIEKLFGINIPENTYFKVFTTLSILGSTIIFLLFNDSGLNTLEEDGKYPIMLKFFTQFILIPLLIIYVIILYLYSFKITLQWELPRGWVTYLILAYSGVGILALLLVYPLRDENAKSWVKAFSKLFYFTLIPLLVLLYVAIFTRILAYNFTEARYFVLALAIWLSILVFYFAFYKKASIKFIPISLFTMGVLALTFPYFNTFSVAKRSQKKELIKLLTENNLLENGKINFETEIKRSVVNDIKSKFEFLDERFQRDYLQQFFNEENIDELPESRYWNFNNKFSNIIDDETSYSNERITLLSKTDIYNIDDYQYAVILGYFSNKTINLNNDILHIDKDSYREQHILFTLNDNDSIDFMPQIKALFDEHKQHLSNSIELDDLSVQGELGPYQIKLLFNSLSKSEFSDGTFHFEMNDFLLVIKEK